MVLTIIWAIIIIGHPSSHSKNGSSICSTGEHNLIITVLISANIVLFPARRCRSKSLYAHAVNVFFYGHWRFMDSRPHSRISTSIYGCGTALVLIWVFSLPFFLVQTFFNTKSYVFGIFLLFKNPNFRKVCWECLLVSISYFRYWRTSQNV